MSMSPRVPLPALYTFGKTKQTMFEGLAEKLQEAFKKLRGDRKLTEADVDVALREVRIALLEADVNFRVVKEFIARVK